MSKRKIHFLGFLANVDDSILKLNIGEGFRTEKMSQEKIKPFLDKVGFHYGTEGQGDILTQGTLPKCYCMIKDNVDEFESTEQGGVVIKWRSLSPIHTQMSDSINLLRLYKEGDILLRFSFLHYGGITKPGICRVLREGPLWSKSIFSLKNDEVSEAQNLIDTIQVPFQHEFLRLAFDSFNLSYEMHNLNLLFLSLMISMEAMFNLSRSEVRFQVSRNTAVLLGKDKENAEQIFRNMKELYVKRSNIVHGSKSQKTRIDETDIMKLREYVRQSIKEIHFIGKEKQEIINVLNSCGFGQRPWRN